MIQMQTSLAVADNSGAKRVVMIMPVGGSTSKTWDQGDWDYDGDVDGNDVGLWAINFTGSGGGVLNITDAAPGAVAALEAMGFTVVPEPTGAAFALGTLACVAMRRRRRA